MRRELDELVDAWLELAATMTVRDLSSDPPPRASLARGAAGIAYVLARIARRDATITVAAKRWLAIARRVAQRRDAFRDGASPPSTYSIMYGPRGLAAIAAIVAASERAVADYATVVRRRLARAPAEYMDGLAGNMLAAVEVARSTGAPAAVALVDDLGARIRDVTVPAPGGFAHGDIGVLVAQLVAARSSGNRVHPDAVATLAAVEPTDVLARNAGLARSWCNGLAGYILAWVVATEVTADDRCRTRALAAAPHLLDNLDEAGGTLCCGLGGRAYALAAVARLDPEGPWLDHATRLATRAFAHQLATGGLLQGFPGLVALAYDLRSPSTARFPLVDVAA